MAGRGSCGERWPGTPGRPRSTSSSRAGSSPAFTGTPWRTELPPATARRTLARVEGFLAYSRFRQLILGVWVKCVLRMESRVLQIAGRAVPPPRLAPHLTPRMRLLPITCRPLTACRWYTHRHEPITITIVRTMNKSEIGAALLAAVASLVVGLLPILSNLLGRTPEPPQESYAARLERLTNELTRASDGVDQILSELAGVAREREAAVARLERELGELSSREQHLQKRIDDLQNVPLPVAEHFVALTSQGEKRSAKRDYVLFGAGVLVSTITSIIFFLISG